MKKIQILNVSDKADLPRFEEFFTFCITHQVSNLKEMMEYYENHTSDVVLFWNLPIDDDLLDCMTLIASLRPDTYFLLIAANKPTLAPSARMICCNNHAPTTLTHLCRIAFDGQKGELALNEFLHHNEIVLALVHVPTIARTRLISTLDSVQFLLRQINDFFESYCPRATRIFQTDSDCFAIVFLENELEAAKDFVAALDILRLEHGFEIDEREIDVEFVTGIVQGKGEILAPKAYSALALATHNNAKFYTLEQSDEEFAQQQHNKIYWMREVHAALKSGRVVPYYQPILNNESGAIEKYETLVRLVDNQGNVILPGIFLDAARESGLMNNITMAVINKSFADFRDCDFEFSINISEECLQDRRIINYLLNRCERYEIPMNRVLLEVLEGINTSQGKVLEHIRELHSKGFKIAIDDFGAANSNFGRLIDLKAEYIKIDGNFVRNIDTDERSYKIVDSIAKFAKSIDAKSIAEFVHSEKVYRIVCELGVDYSQGFLFGEPTPEF